MICDTGVSRAALEPDRVEYGITYFRNPNPTWRLFDGLERCDVVEVGV